MFCPVIWVAIKKEWKFSQQWETRPVFSRFFCCCFFFQFPFIFLSGLLHIYPVGVVFFFCCCSARIRERSLRVCRWVLLAKWQLFVVFFSPTLFCFRLSKTRKIILLLFFFSIFNGDFLGRKQLYFPTDITFQPEATGCQWVLCSSSYENCYWKQNYLVFYLYWCQSRYTLII